VAAFVVEDGGQLRQAAGAVAEVIFRRLPGPRPALAQLPVQTRPVIVVVIAGIADTVMAFGARHRVVPSACLAAPAQGLHHSRPQPPPPGMGKEPHDLVMRAAPVARSQQPSLLASLTRQEQPPGDHEPDLADENEEQHPNERAHRVPHLTVP